MPPKRKRGSGNDRKRNTSNREESQSSTTLGQSKAAFGRCVYVSDRYEKVARIGEGTYGIVYKAIDKVTSRHVALKRSIPHHQADDGFPATSLRELQTLRLCSNHDHIVKLLDVTVSSRKISGQDGGGSGNVFFVFEFCEYDLANLIDDYYKRRGRSPFDIRAVKTLMSHLLKALRYMHSRCLIHRDVKLSNLLYCSKTGMLKLADFGLSRPFAPNCENSISLTPTVASLWYRPPELLFGAITYSQAIDLWAAGCIFTELAFGHPVLNGKNEMDQINKIIEYVGDIPGMNGDDWPEMRDLPRIKDGAVKVPAASSSPRRLLDLCSNWSLAGLRLLTSLLEYNPRKRWTASYALEQSEYLNGAEQPPYTSAEMPRRFL